MSRLPNFFALVCALLLAACQPQAIYDSYVTMNRESWATDSLAVFDIPVDDTSTVYDIFVNIRNTTNYRFQNLYIFADIIAPNGARQRDTLEFFLADDTGAWLGRGHGALRDHRFLYRQGVRFAAPGNYQFQLQQGMRVNPLQGIANMGIRIVVNEDK